jgi:hypothetical protein
VAAALLIAARGVGYPEWENEALRIARRAAVRDSKTAGVKDAGLCHGAAGLAHIFNRFFQAKSDNMFREAAQFWLGNMLEMRRPGLGVAGFPTYHRSDEGKEDWKPGVGLLDGVAGVALTLLAATTDVEPCWDKMLRTSLPIGNI